jgi:hypothetical protein
MKNPPNSLVTGVRGVISGCIYHSILLASWWVSGRIEGRISGNNFGEVFSVALPLFAP